MTSQERMKEHVEALFPLNRCLMGEGYDKSLDYIHSKIPLQIFEFPTGTKLGTWTVPDEWVVRNAWVKFKGKKIIDFKKQPLSLIVGSLPFRGFVDLETLKSHLHYSDTQPDAYLYEYKFYERDWGFTIPKNVIYGKNELGESQFLWEDGEYEVCIDTEYRPGNLRIGVHTIPGQTDREILLFAHLDHPYQANDNLSGVAILMDIAQELKSLYTIKIVFCPETIGSISYALTQDLSNVEFMIALDAVGNLNEEGILLQKSFRKDDYVNKVAHLALRGLGQGYRQGIFRSSIGSDEYVFNDPLIDIPGIMLTTHPYPEYHTSFDTPDRLSYEAMELVKRAVLKIIEYYEKDFIPKRTFKGPLFRSAYGIQTTGAQLNLSWDYLIYSMDGNTPLSSICTEFGLNFEHTLERVERLVADGAVVRRPTDSQGYVYTFATEKPKEF